MTDLGEFRIDSVAAALGEVGDRWTFLVLRECFFGVTRFGDFQRNLGVARNILSDRLAKLVDNAILRRRPYSQHPPRDEYRLTEKGRDLYGVIVALMNWADRWIVDQPPLALTHGTDGGAVEQSLRCAQCGEHLTARDVTYHYTDPTASRSDTLADDKAPFGGHWSSESR